MSDDFTKPPIYDMPQTGQDVTLFAFGGLSLALLIYTIWLCRKRGTLLPMVFFFGGWLTLFLEPVADIMGNAVHAQNGQYEAFSVKGHPVPWHIVLVYPAYFASTQILLFDRFRAQDIPKKWWWRVVGVSAIGVVAIEQLPLHFGLWHYYGEHGVEIGYMPIDMVFPNTAAVIVAALVIYKLMPVLKGWRQLLALGLMPAAAMGGEAGAGMLSYNVLGQNTETASWWLIEGAAAATTALSLIVIWGAIEIVYAKATGPGTTATAEAPASDRTPAAVRSPQPSPEAELPAAV